MLTKKKLEMLLQKCEGFAKPKAGLEQYETPSPLVAEIVYLAFLKGDVEGKVVYDLGCGTGKFAIAAKLLGAKEVVGFDADGEAIEVAKRNAARFGVEISWQVSNVKDIKGKADTIIQNPPFGVQRERADRAFLEKALEIAGVVYTMHKAETRKFVQRYARELGGMVTDVTGAEFALPKSFAFHRKARKNIKVEIYRIVH